MSINYCVWPPSCSASIQVLMGDEGACISLVPSPVGCAHTSATETITGTYRDLWFVLWTVVSLSSK